MNPASHLMCPKLSQQTIRSVSLLISLAFGLSLTLTSAAQDKTSLPAQGSTNYATYYTTQTLSDLTMDETGYQWVQEMVGITRNTDGEAAFDNMSVRCLGYVQQVGEEWFWTGACTEKDADGDQVFTTFDMEAHHIVGGTGKYKGITGKASYTSNTVPRISPTQNAAVVDHAVSWEIK